MKLSLSAAAAPGLALEALDAACRARGLDGVELVVETADDARPLAARARASGARVVALRSERFAVSAMGELARLSSELAVPLSIPLPAMKGHSLADLSQLFAGAGGMVLLGCGADLDMVVAWSSALDSAGNPPCVGFAFEVRPNSEELSASGALLLALGERLRLVRLHGGGPEQRDQDGRGVGPLFVDLAMSGYSRPIVLTPSSAVALPRWREWLSSRKIADCGSAHSSDKHEIDVRDVEPKDRLGTILGAFRALPSGETLRITLDHDPSCMYSALEETEPAGSFAFRKIGDGPEKWQAEVTKI